MNKSKLPDGVRITSIEALNDAIACGNEGFAVSSGILRSSKTIRRSGRKYHVTNHVDWSAQLLTEKQLFSDSVIGGAIKRGALFTYDY